MNASAIITNLFIFCGTDDLMIRIGLDMEAVPFGTLDDGCGSMHGDPVFCQGRAGTAVIDQAAVISDHQRIRIEQICCLHHFQNGIQRTAGGKDQLVPGQNEGIQCLSLIHISGDGFCESGLQQCAGRLF